MRGAVRMNDKVFGNLIFNNGWEKILECEFWNTKSVKIKISAYENEEPNDNQREAYIRFVEDINQISRISLRKMKDYLQKIRQWLHMSAVPDLKVCRFNGRKHLKQKNYLQTQTRYQAFITGRYRLNLHLSMHHILTMQNF